MSEKPEASEKFDWNKYNNQYKKDHYTALRLMLPKESDIKDRIKVIAQRDGISVNQWIIRAIEKELKHYK